MRSMIFACVFLCAAFPGRAADDELVAFRQKEEPAYVALANERAWVKMLERASDLLVKLPADPFALGWAGMALSNLGYVESGAALMRRGTGVIATPQFSASLASASVERKIVVGATCAPLTPDDMAALRPALDAWSVALLRGAEPLPKSIPADVLRAVSSFLADVRKDGVDLSPSKSLEFANGSLTLTVVGVSPQRVIPPLAIHVADGRFADVAMTSESMKNTATSVGISLERIAPVSIAASEPTEVVAVGGAPVVLREGRSNPIQLRCGAQTFERRIDGQVWQTNVEVAPDARIIVLPSWPRVTTQGLQNNERVRLLLAAPASPKPAAIELTSSDVPTLVAPGSYDAVFERPGARLEGQVDIGVTTTPQIVSVGAHARTATFDLRAPSAVAADCARAPMIAMAALARVPEEQMLVIALPDWREDVTADYLGCPIRGSGGTIRVPYLDWPNGTVHLRFGDHEVTLPSPGKPERMTLNPAQYDWMRGTLVLRHVPEGAVVQARGAPLPCRWQANAVTCSVSTGTFSVEVSSAGRVPVVVAGAVAASEEVVRDVTLVKAELWRIDGFDGGAVGVAIVGLGVAGAGFGAVALTRQGLKDINGVIPAGKVQEARSVEGAATTAVIAGGITAVVGLGAEALLLGADVVDHNRLPEWE